MIDDFTENSQSLSQYTDIAYDGTIRKCQEYVYGRFFNEQGDSVKRFFKENSNGRLNLLPANESYGVSNDGIVKITLPYPHPNKYVYGVGTLSDYATLYNDIIKLTDQYVDFSSFDKDNDKVIRSNELHIVFVLASGDGENPCTRPFHAYSTYSSPDGVNLCVGVSYVNAGGSIHGELNSSNVLCHEMAHGMGAIDLYKLPNANAAFLSLMECSVNLDPWHKINMGFVDPTIVTSSGTYTLNSLDPNDLSKYNVLKIPLVSSGDEYLLVENRQLVSFDAIPKDDLMSGGIAIWHIKGGDIRLQTADKTIYTEMREYMGIPYEHYIYNKLYYIGEKGNTYYAPNTSPSNSNTFDGKTSGVSITINSPSLSTMSVTVKIIKAPQNLKATDNGNSTILTWNPVPSATNYEVSIDDGEFFSVGLNTSYTCQNTNKHFYKVRTKGLNIVSPESKPIDTISVLYGDINRDGTITTADKDVLLSYLLEPDVNTLKDVKKFAADVNGDGNVDTLDSVLILQYCKGEITQFPVGKIKVITYGDVNRDGFLTDADQDLIRSMGDSITDLEQRIAANTDGDYIIDVMDANHIDNFLKGYSYHLPVMYD